MSSLEQEQKDKAASGQPSAVDVQKFGGSVVRDDENYEEKATQDAIRRARDAELEALATLTLFRNSMSSNRSAMFHLEREQMISPREVDRQLSSEDRGPRR